MSRLIKSTDVDFRAEAIRFPVIVPVMYEAPGKRQAVQRGVEQTARAAVDRALREAEQRAVSIMERAKAEAVKERDRARAEGLEAGRKEGFAQGKAQADAEARELLEGARSELEAARKEARRIVAASEPQVTEIALAVARKVIKREVLADPEIVLDNIRQALESVGREDSVTVRTSPVEVAVVHDGRDSLRHEFPGIGEIVVREDISVEPGGCVVSTGRGSVDAQIESQVESVTERLVEVVGQRDSTGDGTADN